MIIPLPPSAHPPPNPQAAQSGVPPPSLRCRLHDDYWPSDGGCVSDKGRHLPEAEVRRRAAAGGSALDGVGLGCLWRATVELLIHATPPRPVWATSHSGVPPP